MNAKNVAAFLLFIPLLLSFDRTRASESRIRERIMKVDDILIVNTGLGIATIIQIPETIQSMIIGDQSAFKVEYVDRAVTIKPLRFSAKTNLYLITAGRRYDLKLQCVTQDLADYVVYVKQAKTDENVRWRPVPVSAENGRIRFSINRIGATTDGFIVIDGLLTSRNGESSTIAPKDFWVLQGGQSRVINSLFLSDHNVSKGKSVIIGLSVAKSDLVSNVPVTIDLTGDKKIELRLPASCVWK